MRKHFYLVVDDPKNPGKVGGVDVVDRRIAGTKKNEQRTVDKRDLGTGETWQRTLVSLGYYDFEDEMEYETRCLEVAKRKLAEVDEQHLEDAGLDPEKVIPDEA